MKKRMTRREIHSKNRMTRKVLKKVRGTWVAALLVGTVGVSAFVSENVNILANEDTSVVTDDTLESKFDGKAALFDNETIQAEVEKAKAAPTDAERTVEDVKAEIKRQEEANLPIYVVQAGDTIQLLAEALGKSAEEFAHSNGLSVDSDLVVGDLLKGVVKTENIPASSKEDKEDKDEEKQEDRVAVAPTSYIANVVTRSSNHVYGNADVATEIEVTTEADETSVEKNTTPTKSIPSTTNSSALISENSVKSDSVTSSNTENPVTPSKTEDVVTPSKTEDAVTPPSTEDVVTPPKTEDAVTPPSTEDVVTPPKTEDPVTPPKTEDPVTPPSTEDVVTPPKSEDPVTPPSTEDVVTPPKTEDSVTPSVVQKALKNPLVVPENASLVDRIRIATVNALNQLRQNNGLELVKEDEALNKAALNNAENTPMTKLQDFHSKDSYYAKEKGYPEIDTNKGKHPQALANLGWISLGNDTVEKEFDTPEKWGETLINSWYADPYVDNRGHRNQMLVSKWNEVGTGINIVPNEAGGEDIHFVQYYGNRDAKEAGEAMNEGSAKTATDKSVSLASYPEYLEKDKTFNYIDKQDLNINGKTVLANTASKQAQAEMKEGIVTVPDVE